MSYIANIVEFLKLQICRILALHSLFNSNCASNSSTNHWVLPKPNTALPALGVELKWKETAEAVIDQIKKNNYPSVLSDYYGEILLVGIYYDPETNEHSCMIEKAVK